MILSKKLFYGFWVLLFLITITTLTQNLSMGMMGLTVFTLAYLTKGMRRNKG